MSNQSVTPTKNIWIVFTGKTDIGWLKILKPGFRHCYVLMNDGVRWVSIDPLSGYTDIQIYHHIDASFDLPQWLSGRGERIIQFTCDYRKKNPAPLMVYTCVEAVKRILGIHKRFVVTPWQLYQYLKRNTPYQQPLTLKGKESWAV